MVPLQEHQRSAPVLLHQLLSALLYAQLSLSFLLALHQTSTPGYGLHHGVHTGGLSLAHVLCDNKRHAVKAEGWCRVITEVTGLTLPGCLVVAAAAVGGHKSP